MAGRRCRVLKLAGAWDCALPARLVNFRGSAFGGGGGPGIFGASLTGCGGAGDGCESSSDVSEYRTIAIDLRGGNLRSVGGGDLRFVGDGTNSTSDVGE